MMTILEHIKNFDAYSIGGTIVLLIILTIAAIYANSLDKTRKGGRYTEVTGNKEEKPNK